MADMRWRVDDYQREIVHRKKNDDIAMDAHKARNC